MKKKRNFLLEQTKSTPSTTFCRAGEELRVENY